MPEDPEGESYAAGKVKDRNWPWTQKPKHKGSVRIADDSAGAIFSSRLCFSLCMESILPAA